MTAAAVLAALALGACSPSAEPEGDPGPQMPTATDAQEQIEADQGTVDPADADESASPGGPESPEPAPGGGDVDTEVEVGEQTVLPASDLDAEVSIDGGVDVSIVEVARSEVEGRTVGEIGGPGIVVRVELSNTTGDEVDLGRVTVNAEDGAQLPLSSLSGPPAENFFGLLADGDSAEATYVFGLPDDAALPLTITVNPAPEMAVAVFVGDPA